MISWRYETKWGTFAIIPDGVRFNIILNEDSLGNYYSAEQALDDLIGGAVQVPFGVPNTSEIGLPDLSEWEIIFLR